MPVDNDHPLHQHNTDDIFDKMLEEAKAERTSLQQKGSSDSSLSVNSDQDLTDNYQIEDEKDRSRYISAILCDYKNSYGNKVDFQRRYRKILFWGCSCITVIFAFAVLLILYYSIRNVQELNISGVSTIIAAVVSLVASILELVRIMTKYCFPANDEDYIVQIVKSIQENDLKTFVERNRSAGSSEKSDFAREDREDKD